LAGRPGAFFALKKDVMLDKSCSLASASVFGTFLKGGILAPNCALIAKSKNASNRSGEKKSKKWKKIKKIKK
jgi:hypothetical protein